MGAKLASDKIGSPGTLARGQCWRVRIRKGSIETTVKVLDFDAKTVVLRDVDNVDLRARYQRVDVEFLHQITTTD